ncbi:hypothetical protein ACSS6W_004636 [Trichoderma asperelloides]
MRSGRATHADRTTTVYRKRGYFFFSFFFFFSLSLLGGRQNEPSRETRNQDSFVTRAPYFRIYQAIMSFDQPTL